MLALPATAPVSSRIKKSKLFFSCSSPWCDAGFASYGTCVVSNKKEQALFFLLVSLVPETGLEPARRLAYAPKAYVYTNFTTRACLASLVQPVLRERASWPRLYNMRFANGLPSFVCLARASRTGFLASFCSLALRVNNIHIIS